MTAASGGALFGVAIVGGVVNAIAGGGTFIVFPSLLLAGVPAIQANATNTAALWPGVLFSLFAYRQELSQARYRVLMASLSLAGGLVGAIVLLRTPPAFFERSVPFLLLVATLLFACNPLLTRRLTRSQTPGVVGPGRFAVVAVVLFLIAVYGGYFGGGIGILILGALGLLGITDFHRMNAMRLLMSCSANATAVVAFSLAGAVAWPEATLMLVGAIAGGYGGARLARRLRAALLRQIVIALGLSMSAYFFYRQFA
ncbi:MAG TPA: sulfite exporter TauE/SafE family protein [Chloroflexota bacterium]|nr:sulfite exporter TauE/SafE family protein [Chloroflexota bacterium]